tara:strand:+ start:161 stop:406 length:246 start_codon:yes stop_codon:yes gene_type:complete
MKNQILSEWGNFIPNIQNNDRYTWHECYIEQLIDIYNIIKSVIKERYNKKIDWKSNRLFNDLSIFIYNCSSKYIESEFLLK